MSASIRNVACFQVERLCNRSVVRCSLYRNVPIIASTTIVKKYLPRIAADASGRQNGNNADLPVGLLFWSSCTGTLARRPMS